MSIKQRLAKLERLEKRATAADDAVGDLPVILHKDGERIAMTAEEWRRYEKAHPGDYITLYKFGDE